MFRSFRPQKMVCPKVCLFWQFLNGGITAQCRFNICNMWAVGRAVTSYTRDPRFKSSANLITINCIKKLYLKDKNKEKESWNGPIKKFSMSYLLFFSICLSDSVHLFIPELLFFALKEEYISTARFRAWI